MKIRKVIAIDSPIAEHAAHEAGFNYFPLREFREVMMSQKDVDIIETLYTLIKRVPDDDSPESIAAVSKQFEQKRYALEMSGARVIECPAKRSSNSPSGYKQSDDQRLMITTLSTCLKLRPDYLCFVGADGDYAPLLWELRNEGIRTEVIASERSLANDLRRVAASVRDLFHIFAQIKERYPDLVR